MVLTNYECWASIGGDNKVCDITLEQAQLRSQIDLFNPRTLGACGITHKVECSQQNGSWDTFSKNVSQISSNGYYGFTYVNNNDNVAGNGNDVKTCVGNHQTKVQHHVFNNNLVTNRNKTTVLDKTSNLQPNKRSLVDRESANVQESEFGTTGKRCRLETDLGIQDSVDLREQARNMDIDDIEFHNEANSPQKVKSPDKSGYQNLALTINFECDKNAIGKSKMCHTFHVQELKSSRMHDARKVHQNISCYEKLKKSGSNELFLEQMFSETHGSGAYLCAQHEF